MKTALLQKCILNHRGSVKLERNSIEELCVADADAVSHFDSVPSLLYLAYVEKGMDIEHGSSFVRKSLSEAIMSCQMKVKRFTRKNMSR